MNTSVDTPTTLDRAAIARLVDRFYGDVRADPLLGPIFATHVDGRWDSHLARMTDFWCAAMKLERGFRGNVYGRHMALAGITERHLQRWLWLWFRATGDLMAPADAQRLRWTAVGVARVMHLGWFGTLPDHDALAPSIDSAAP